MSMDLGPNIYDAVSNDSVIRGLISRTRRNPSVFTRIPIPDGVAYPYIVISHDVAVSDSDAVNHLNPVVTRDIFVYGAQPDDYRVVNEIGYRLREIFHRKRDSIVNNDYDIVNITVQGPNLAPSADAEIIGRVVTLTIQLASK